MSSWSTTALTAERSLTAIMRSAGGGGGVRIVSHFAAEPDHSSILRGRNGNTYNPLMATAPKPCRRWFQFRLRTLLVLMLLACLVIGSIVVPIQRVSRQRAAAEAIERLGGSVSWSSTDSPEQSWKQTWLRPMFGNDFFAHPEFVDIPNDAALNYLSEMPDTPRLRMGHWRFTDAGLASVSRLSQLMLLDLSGTQVTDAGMEHLKGLTHLQWLSLDNTQVTDAGLANLKGLTHLQWLSLTNTRVADAGLIHVKELPQVDTLSLMNTQITDAGLKHLKGLVHLRWLSLDDTRVTDVGLIHVKELTELKALCLSGAALITDAGLEHIRGLTTLELLTLNGTHVTDAGLEHLQGMSQLQELWLSDTQASDSVVKRMQQILPNCRISRR